MLFKTVCLNVENNYAMGGNCNNKILRGSTKNDKNGEIKQYQEDIHFQKLFRNLTNLIDVHNAIGMSPLPRAADKEILRSAGELV